MGLFRKSLCFLGAGCLLLAGTVGCEGQNNIGGSTFTAPNPVDLAIADSYAGTNRNVKLYFDVLDAIDGTTQAPEPDLVLDNGGATFPSTAVLALRNEGDGTGSLFIFDLSLGLAVYRDYRNLADSDTPDFILTSGGSGVSGLTDILFTETDMILADQGDSNVKIYRDPAALTADVVPDVEMGAASEIVAPTGLAYVPAGFQNGQETADRLVVQNLGPAPTNGSCISIFDDVAGLTSASVPDVELDITDSFLSTSCPFHIAVGNNTLFASNGISGGPGSAVIFVFNDLDALSDFALPSAILLDDASGLEYPSGMVVEPTSDTLYVMNLNLSTSVIQGAPALKGFSPASALADNQLPNVIIDPIASGLLGGGVTGFPFPHLELEIEGGSLFARGSASQSFNPDGIAVFTNVAGLTSDSTPDLYFPASLGAISGGDLQNASAFAVENAFGLGQ